MNYFPVSPIPEWPAKQPDEIRAVTKHVINEDGSVEIVFIPATCLSCGARAWTRDSLPCGH